MDANRIAKWDGANWEAMGDGVFASWVETATVQDIAIDSDGKVYIGGSFDRSSLFGDTLNHCGVYVDGEWLNLGNGLAQSSSQSVSGMMADGKDVWFVGYFAKGTGDVNDKVNTAIWNENQN